MQAKLLKAESEIDRMKNVEAYLKDQCKTLENVIIEKAKLTDQLQKDLDAMRLASEERVVHFQLQLNQCKKAEESKSMDLQAARSEIEKLSSKISSLSIVKEEKETLLESNKEMIVALQARLMEIEPEVVQLRDKVKDHERRYSALQLLKVEQDKVVANAQGDFKAMLAEKDSLQQRIKDLDEARMKAEGQALKLSSLNEEMNQLKEEIEEKSAIIIRLRSEAQTSERNHAMRTAMLATCEAQLEALQKEMEGKDGTIVEALERVSSLQIQMSSLQARMEERTQESVVQIEGLNQELQREREMHSVLLKAKEQERLDALETTKKEFGKKAAMARQLLAEREEEVRVLSTKVKQMQEEIASGAPTDRKLLEFAQAQSRRDTMNGVHRDTREVAFQQLQVKLASKDYELAQTQQSLHQLMQEVLELRKIKQREGINMDYLKNVILQYMIFPIASSERMALIPVIAMLLQFSPKEMQDINHALRDPNFGVRAVKEVKRVDSNARNTGSSQGGKLSSSSSHGNIGMDKSTHGAETAASKSSEKLPSVPRQQNGKLEGYKPPLVPAASGTTGESKTTDVHPSQSDQDLHEKLRRITGDILDLSTMSNEDIDQYLTNMTPSTDEALSPQNNRNLLG